MSATEPTALFIVWLDGHYEERKDIVLRILQEVAEHAAGFRSIVTAFAERTQCTMVLYHMDTAQDWEEYFDSSVVPMILSNTENKALCVWEECRGFYELEEGRKRIRQLLDWSLALGNEKLISQKRIDGISVSPLKYLPEMSLRLKQAVIKKDEKEFAACFVEFLNYCRAQTHRPKDIKEACITFLWTILNTAREYISFEENELEVQALLEAVMGAFTWEDIENIMRSLYKK